MDLRLGTSPLGSPETAIISRMVVELCRYYQLPCMVPGISSDSKKADCQAIFEKTLTGVSAAISGADLIVGIGGLETGLTFDYGQAVLDDEMVRLIKYITQDTEVNNESLSTDLIDEVGHFGEF
jgi:trimethylamine--corrinoid protein Co-methyltransferase